MNAIVNAAPVTIGIAVVTAVVSLAITVFGLDQFAAVYAGFIPLRASLGFAGDAQGLVPVLLTPLSSALVHGGFVHLAFNMLTLVYCGIAAERAIGPRGVAILYPIGAYAACAAQWSVDPQSTMPMIGASGAASAIVGAYALLYGQQRTRDVGPIPAWLLHVLWLLAAWTVLNLAVGLLSTRAGMPIAAAAHIGGFLAGLALCRPLLMWRWRSA